MARVTNGYWQGFDTGSTTTTTATSGWYANHMYNNGIISKAYFLETDRLIPVAKPKKKTFEEELQNEIDNWLNIFEES